MTDALLAEGQAALAAGDWASARTAFEAAEPSAEALSGLGTALMWLGETDAAVRTREQAYAAFCRRPDTVQAAITALALYFLFRSSLGNVAASRGWLARAGRLAEELQLPPLTGWVVLARAHDSDDPAAAERFAREACEAARATGDRDLDLCALSQLALLGEGLSNRAIADRLFVSQKTAQHHVASVLFKLDLANRAQAAAYAVRRLHEREHA